MRCCHIYMHVYRSTHSPSRVSLLEICDASNWDRPGIYVHINIYICICIYVHINIHSAFHIYIPGLSALRASTGLRNYITELYYGLRLRNYITDLRYRITLWDHITELYHWCRTILRNYITQLYYQIILRNHMTELCYRYIYIYIYICIYISELDCGMILRQI